MSARIGSIREFAATARGRRQGLGLSQAELAIRARVSRQWISEFEAGKPTAELALVLRLLDALELRLDVDECGADAGAGEPASGASVDLDALLDDYRER